MEFNFFSRGIETNNVGRCFDKTKNPSYLCPPSRVAKAIASED